MRRTKKPTLKELVGIVRSRPWREVLLSALSSWNRHQVVRIIGAMALAWLVGAAALHLAERGVNDFATWSDSLWSVWVLLFSGLEQPPEDGDRPRGRDGPLSSAWGRRGSSRRAWRRSWSSATCGGATWRISRWRTTWSSATGPRAAWNGSARSTPRSSRTSGPSSSSTTRPTQIDLPDKQDDAGLQRRLHRQGRPDQRGRAPAGQGAQGPLGRDPRPTTARASTPTASRSSPASPIRNICRGEQQPNIAVECRNPSNRHHLKKAGADEIISSGRARPPAPGPHGALPRHDPRLPGAADRRPRRQRDVPARRPPRRWSARTSSSSPACSSATASDRRSCLLIGIQRGEEMHAQPDRRRGGPAQGRRPADPPEPRLPRPVRSPCRPTRPSASSQGAT